MSTSVREAIVGDALRVLMRESENHPKGAVANTSITLPFPLPVGSTLVIGSMKGQRLDALATVELTRRIGMGPCRIFFGLLPDAPTSLSLVSGDE